MADTGIQVIGLPRVLHGCVNRAVDKAVHRADPVRFHLRYPKGECPLCRLNGIDILAFEANPELMLEVQQKMLEMGIGNQLAEVDE